MKKTCIAMISVALLTTTAFADDKKEVERVKNSGTVMSEILNIPDDIPQDLLDKADCVVVLPSVLKFGIGGGYGRGVMTCRSGEKFKGHD
jgi:lipid-binding SYLF domain-containing protein